MKRRRGAGGGVRHEVREAQIAVGFHQGIQISTNPFETKPSIPSAVLRIGVPSRSVRVGRLTLIFQHC